MKLSTGENILTRQSSKIGRVSRALSMTLELASLRLTLELASILGSYISSYSLVPHELA